VDIDPDPLLLPLSKVNSIYMSPEEIRQPSKAYQETIYASPLQKQGIMKHQKTKSTKVEDPQPLPSAQVEAYIQELEQSILQDPVLNRQVLMQSDFDPDKQVSVRDLEVMQQLSQQAHSLCVKHGLEKEQLQVAKEHRKLRGLLKSEAALKGLTE
jgi:hypothetical protein